MPSSLQMPAMSRAGPVERAVGVPDDDPAGALELVEGGLVGDERALAVLDRDGELLAVGEARRPRGRPCSPTVSRTSAWMNRRPAFLVSAPGSRCASQRIWKPLQMPSTGSPALAAGISSPITGENLAIAPQRR